MFAIGSLVKLKVNPKLPLVVVCHVTEHPGLTQCVIRHQCDNGHAIEFPVSPCEIVSAEPAKSEVIDPIYTDPIYTEATGRNVCPYCEGSGCEICSDVGSVPRYESIDLENGQTATVQATIQADAKRRGTEHVRRIEDEIRKAKAAREQTPEILLDLTNQRAHANPFDEFDSPFPGPYEVVGKPDAEFTGPLQVLPLEWIDNTTESESTPHATYQVDQGPNGWTAYHFGEGEDYVPDLESDHPFPTREQAKDWCHRHAAGEELEPRRCERCKLPTNALPYCPQCVGSLPGQAVAVPMGYTTPEF